MVSHIVSNADSVNSSAECAAKRNAPHVAASARLSENAAPLLSHPKIVSREALKARLAELVHAGKRVVFTNGCYDILHPGHVNLLARAKALGDVLILGLNSDNSVRRQGKGSDRPVNPFPVRAFVLAHLESIDFVVEFDEDTPLELIQSLAPYTPSVLVKGGDWSVENIVGGDIVQKNGGKVVSLALLEGYSTTGLIKKIRATAP